MNFGNIGIARKEDKVSCQKEGHGITKNVEGNPNYLDRGGVAFHGYKCGYGYTLVTSFPAAKSLF